MVATAIGATGLAACAPPSRSNTGESEDLGEVELALSTIPAGVQCVRVTGTVGGTSVTPPLLTVGAGASSASLSIGQLPAGAATFSGSAFNVACSTVTTSTVPNWTAASTTVTLVAGAPNQVMLTFVPNNPVTVNANFTGTPLDLGLSSGTSRLRMADGTVREWGMLVNNGIAQTMSQEPGITDALQISAGGQPFSSLTACVRQAAGGVSCWGQGLLLGVPPGTFTTSPVALTFSRGSLPITHLSVGANHACAIQFGVASCWGDNSVGQFGNGTTISSGAPVVVVTASKAFAGNNSTCFIFSNGTMGCAGLNSSGQLGNGTTTNASTPQTVAGLGDVTEVGMGMAHVCALRGDGTVRCWGDNSKGQLGDTTFTQRLTPVQVSGITDAVHVAAGANHTCVLRQTGTVSCWGQGDALGDGVGNNRATAADVPGLTGVIAMDTHLGSHTCAVLSDRTVRCWGENDRGQIDFSEVFAAKPTQVMLQ
jgi:hypothetical protein